MPRRVFVTGIGIICAAGKDTASVLTSLQQSQSGIAPLQFLKTSYDHLPFGEVKCSNEQMAEIAGISNNKTFSRTALLGMVAAREAAKNFLGKNNSTVRTGLISATTVGGMPLNERYYREQLEKNVFPELIETYDCADSTERIADLLKIKQHVSTISTACSSSANAIMNGARMIRHNQLDRVITGGTDALTRLTVNGFNALEILDSAPCKPFDAFRHGLTLGEGAAFLVLEAEEIADPNTILCEVKGYGNANDAFHATASSPDGNGAAIAMQKALQSADITPEKINYINAHGTGTEVNDLSEGKAIMQVFGSAIPNVSSTKSFTGHTLAAAGAVEAVISILCLRHKFIPANLNYSNPIAELSFVPVRECLQNMDVNSVMSNSFGFGGNNTSLIFSTC